MTEEQTNPPTLEQPAAPTPMDYIRGRGRVAVTLIGNNSSFTDSRISGYDQIVVAVGDGNRVERIDATASQESSVFARLDDAISRLDASQEDVERLLSASAEMREHVGKPSFMGVYTRFIGLAADHLGVVLPILAVLFP